MYVVSLNRLAYALLFAIAVPAAADDETNVVFHSDVALVRVDAQVLDRENRAVTGLRAEDFVLRQDGRVLSIRNFASENMPIDILLLLDVSGSMRVHVQRIADAAHQALNVLAPDDRVGIMVFDRTTRLRMPFRSSRDDVNRELERLLRQEGFNGGTDITYGLLRAADYVRQEARRDARRAIVILTDDQTQRERDEASVERALERADAVLSLLLAPDAMGHGGYGRHGGGYPGGGYPRGGGGYPGGGIGGPLGGIIFPRRGGYGGRPGGYGYPETHSAGTAEIARQSGGDTMSVDDAAALETTLERLRRRYALYFHLPEDAKAGEERSIQVDLADGARRRYPTAEVHYRRVFLAPGGSAQGTGEAQVTRAPSHLPPVSASSDSGGGSGGSSTRRRVAVDEPEGPRVNMAGSTDAAASAGAAPAPGSAASAPAASDISAAPANAPAKNTDGTAPRRGWRRVGDPEPGTPAGPIKPAGQ